MNRPEKNCPEMEELLNDHVDELLSPAEQQRLKEHLMSCAPCRETVESLVELREQAAALPQSLEPPRDLWPGIQAAVLSERRSQPQATPFWRSALPLAAAVALVMLTAWATLRLTAPGSTQDDTSRPASVTSQQTFRAMEVDYRQATGDLLAILDARRHEFAPETIAIVEENLLIIDQAIQDAWAALESDSVHLENGYRIHSLYQKKVALLQRAIRLPAES